MSSVARLDLQRRRDNGPRFAARVTRAVINKSYAVKANFSAPPPASPPPPPPTTCPCDARRSGNARNATIYNVNPRASERGGRARARCFPPRPVAEKAKQHACAFTIIPFAE